MSLKRTEDEILSGQGLTGIVRSSERETVSQKPFAMSKISRGKNGNSKKL
jgi:hypothetical protein